MCVACDKRFKLASEIRSVGHEYHCKGRLQSNFELNSEQDSYVSYGDKRLNLTAELEIARHELSPQNQIAK